MSVWIVIFNPKSIFACVNEADARARLKAAQEYDTNVEIREILYFHCSVN